MLLSKKLTGVLACPKCKGKLRYGNFIYCDKCRLRFAVKNGIPDMLLKDAQSGPADEPIDVLDSEGRPTGKVLPRRTVHSKGLWHTMVRIWIYNSKGEVLLQKRTETMESFPCLWDISSGGHVLAGETADQGALRELYEELDIKVPISKLKKWKVFPYNAEPKKGFIIREFEHAYLLKFDGHIKKTMLQKEELATVKFVPLAILESELKDPAKRKRFVPKHEFFLEAIAKIRQELGAGKF